MIRFTIHLILLLLIVIFSINSLISLFLYAYSSISLGELEGLTLGHVAYTVSPAKLNLVQSITERYIGSWLWDNYFVFFLKKTVTFNIIFWFISLVLAIFIRYIYVKKQKRRKHFFR